MDVERSPTWSACDEVWGCQGGDKGEDAIPLVSDPLPRMSLKGSGLKKKELLTRGAQGAVYASYDPSLQSSEEPGDPPGKGALVAVKRLYISPNDFGVRGVAETALREATLLAYLSQKQKDGRHGLEDASARVVHLHRVVEAPHRELCLVLEYCPLDLRRLAIDERAKWHRPGVVRGFSQPSQGGGNEERNRKLTLPVIKYIMRRVLRVVQFLHEQCHILHRDLKLSNILITRNAELRLSDFGSARFTKPLDADAGSHDDGSGEGEEEEEEENTKEEEDTYTPGAMRTTRLYQAPECLLGNHNYGPAMEVWSLGVIFAELLRRTHLFSGDSDLGLLSAIWKLLGAPAKKGSGGNTADAAEGSAPVPAAQAEPTLPRKFNTSVVPPDGYDLLQRMLSIVPEDRITVPEALSHPFLACRPAEDQEAKVAWEQLVKDAVTAAEARVCVRMPALPQSTAVMGLLGGGTVPLMGQLGLGSEEDSEEDGEEEEVAPPVFRLNL